MARTIEDFWKLLDEIQGEDTDLTDSVKSIAKNEKTVSERLFTTVIDQIAYNSRDYERIRSFLRDWYAAHRSLTTYQSNISDIYQMPNDQLDDLFQSFGYDYSTSMRDPIGNNPSLNKINFFLDLVNLYKIKGTPQALVDVLQYYGFSEVDLYEMSLQFDDRESRDSSDLIFKGKVVAGTTGSTSPVYLPFDLLTQGDPHWLQTESEIRQLFDRNVISFPSQTPYFAVKPEFDEEATDAATGMLERRIQDQYDSWELAGFPAEDTDPYLPQDAVMTITGDQCSILTLYLSCIYTFNKEYEVGADSPPNSNRFICYDGTNADAIDILNEFREITAKPDSRLAIKENYEEYLDTFSRELKPPAPDANFLQTHEDAGIVLGVLNPTVKANLDNLATDNNTILGSLLKDLGEWVRANISYGFINISYILFGIDSLFGQLRDVVEFFKPYRARIIPLELMQLRNRLFNSILVEDSLEMTQDMYIHDFLVGDSAPCCYGTDSTCSVLVGSREYYDCGSYFDIGAVTDLPTEIQIDIEQHVHDYFRCPSFDTTGYVISEYLIDVNLPQTQLIPEGVSQAVVVFDAEKADTDYTLALNMFNEDDVIPSIYSYVITEKLTTGFTVQLSGVTDSPNYYLTWDIADATSSSGVEILTPVGNEVTVSLPTTQTTDYSIGLALENLVDGTNADILLYTITEKTPTSFTVQFSEVIPPNYRLEWTVYEYGRVPPIGTPQTGIEAIGNGVSSHTVIIAYPKPVFDNYTVSLEIINTDDTSVSNYGYVITSKDIGQFTVQFSGPMDSGNYKLAWAFTQPASLVYNDYFYRQTGQMRNFDDDGTFDCTHGMDQVDIGIDDAINYILLEDGNYLLQEDGGRLLL